MAEISIGEEVRKEIFKKGATLAEVIKERGTSGVSLKSVVNKILPEWHGHVLPKAKDLFAKPLPDFVQDEKRDGLKVPPIRRVDIGDVTVHIVGVNHGMKGFVPQRSEYARIIRDFVSYTNQNEGYVWMTEEGVGRDFGVKEIAGSLKDSTSYMQHIIEDSKKREKDGIDKPAGFFKKAGRVMQAAKTFLRDRSDLRRGSTSLQSPELKALIAPISQSVKDQDARSILLSQAYFDITKLPEPLDMETSFVLTYGDDTNKPSLMMDRSYIQARQLEQAIKALKEKRSQEGNSESGKSTHLNVGLLTGFFHASQIEYFLIHPTYELHKSLAGAKQQIKQESL